MSCLTVEPPHSFRWLNSSAAIDLSKANMLATACVSSPVLRSPEAAEGLSFRANRFRPVIDVSGGNQFLDLLGNGNRSGFGEETGVAGSLKRKRPPPINIPSLAPISSQMLRCPDGPQEVQFEDSRYAVCCKKGRRLHLEDTYAAVLDIHGNSKQAFFGVFDGHGGHKAAEFTAAQIGKNIVDSLPNANNLEQAVRNGYLSTDTEFAKQGASGGTTCVTALIVNGSLVASNVGDSRAVLSRNGIAEALTQDHHPGRDDERQRIENLGGYVDNRHGIWRVQGTLAVSRAIGDFHMKEFIIPEPESRRVNLTSDCEFLIMASDGLWDKVGNQEAVNIARPYCTQGQKPAKLAGGPIAACKKLIELAVQREAVDDISVMIIQLGQFYCSA